MKLLYIVTLVAFSALAAENKVKLEELPPAVQAAVREQTKNATLVGLSTEKAKGKTVYELETRVGGRSPDLLLDQTGCRHRDGGGGRYGNRSHPCKIRNTEACGGRTISKVEKVTGAAISYEAVIRTKSGKTVEYAVNADGTLHKEN